MPIRQITIVGTGLIGGSFALALRKRKFAGRIVGCDREGILIGRTNAAPSTADFPILVMRCGAASWWCWLRRCWPLST